MKFTNRVIKADITVDESLVDFADNHHNSAFHSTTRNEQVSSVLIEIDYYKRSSEYQNDPLTEEQARHLETIESIIDEARKQGLQEIELFSH